MKLLVFFIFILILLIGAGGVWSEGFQFEPLPISEWFGSPAGVSDEVLPPWTPLKVRKLGNLVLSPPEGRETGKRRDLSSQFPNFPIAVSCWGRVYSYHRSPLPSQIQTMGHRILETPVRLVVRTGERKERKRKR